MFAIATALALLALVPGLRLGHAHEASEAGGLTEPGAAREVVPIWPPKQR